MNDVQRANLDALAARGLALALRESDAAGAAPESGPHGPRLSVRTPDGRLVRLHSARDPAAEADRLIGGAFAKDAPNLLIVIGLGLGYVLDSVERRSDRTKVLAIEPLPVTLGPMLQRRDWTEWIRSGRLTLIPGPEFPGAADAWKLVDGRGAAPPVVVHPVVNQEFPREVAVARRIAERALFGARANQEARTKFAGPYLRNTLGNLSTIAAEGDVTSLFDSFSGVPCIIVAAGPSLDRSIEDLRTAGQRAVLVAVDTAVRPLVASGIRPHLVVSVDPSEVNARHLLDLPDTAGMWFVAEGSIDSRVFPVFAGRTFIFKVSSHHPWPWLERAGIRRGRLRAWGNVLTSAFDLAVKMGCNPTIFVGADLAFTDGRPYCRGTTFETDWARATAGGRTLPEVWQRWIASRHPVETQAVDGRQTETTGTMLAVRDGLLEQMAAYPDRRFVNAGMSGVLGGRSVELIALPDVLRTLPDPGDLTPTRRIEAAWQKGRAPGGA